MNIEPISFGRRTSTDPFIRPYQGNASVYFEDPDGNSLELMCYIDVPNEGQEMTEKYSIEEWEKITFKNDR